MIVRILAEGQYELTGEAEANLRRLDETLLEHLRKGDRAAFQDDFSAVLDLVRRFGRPLSHDSIVPSDFVLPGEVPSLDEARRWFHTEEA